MDVEKIVDAVVKSLADSAEFSADQRVALGRAIVAAFGATQAEDTQPVAPVEVIQ